MESCRGLASMSVKLRASTSESGSAAVNRPGLSVEPSANGPWTMPSSSTGSSSLAVAEIGYESLRLRSARFSPAAGHDLSHGSLDSC